MIKHFYIHVTFHAFWLWITLLFADFIARQKSWKSAEALSLLHKRQKLPQHNLLEVKHSTNPNHKWIDLCFTVVFHFSVFFFCCHELLGCWNLFDTHTPTHTSARADVSLQALHWVSWHCKGHYKLLMVSMALSAADTAAASTLSARNYTIDLFALVCSPLCVSIRLFSSYSSVCTCMRVLVCSWNYVFVFFCQILSRLLWVIGFLPRLFAHSDMEIIAVVAPCYLLQPCVCAAQSLE